MDLKRSQNQQLVYIALSEAGFALATKLADDMGGEVHGFAPRCASASITLMTPQLSILLICFLPNALLLLFVRQVL